ncbi:type II toxin-antitoxin system RelE/ParE family toxin [Rhizobium sp. TH2]|uniref:type II toxin-antitoxin system RelE/ParE family toxin n=1 Tax=Rhizobium sp. TH2 TaxID=2775403 RepID=UPI002157C499|nr:type II toxin-antitoxin system RelE/ParE family toxin [Rhizobium sp. TH2]UVC10750.1 type II toxin-antitoxin system RelE/ParE family toxin [Rhizobium sp. TH2]
MKLRYTRTALRQIDSTLDYIASRSPQGARSVNKRIITAFALIQEYPQAGQMTSRDGYRRLVLTPYPYVIFYRVTADEIVISRFRHAAQRPASS